MSNFQRFMNRIIQTFSAISLLLFAFIIAWVVSEKNLASNDSLHRIYDNNMKPCMNYWTTDPSYTDTVSMHMQAMKLYDKGDYALALEAFQRFEPNENEQSLYNLYTGICLLQTNFNLLAISRFQEAIEVGNKFEIIQLSKWYLALAYLKSGRQNKAIAALNKLIEINASQKYQAQNIIKQIDIARNPISHLLVFVTK
jgi:tetratricopeptide (TPR) repeat protein